MGQVFQNLIGNAIKFMDKEIGSIHIGCTEEKNEYVFYVNDNGPGIEHKYFAKVFQIFQTLNSRDVKESTGVGLALVKKIVELYGGTIWIESEKGKGCTFTFRLPKQKLHE
jgi:signal transduction histidine kinase